MFSTTKFLGLSLRDKSILAAEVNCAGDQAQVLSGQEFMLEGELSYAHPDALGRALRQFLKQSGISSRRTVIGVPAKWLLAREKEIPPAAPAAATSLLRLQAERDFTGDGKEMVFDFAGDSSPDKAQSVLLVAMLREQLDRIIEMADSAGLALEAITSSSLALSNAAGDKSEDNLYFVVGSGSAEVVVSSSQAPRLLRHISLVNSENTATMLAIEAQRALAGVGRRGDSGNPTNVRIWNGTTFSTDDAERLQQRIGSQVRLSKDFSELGVTPTQEQPGGLFAPAVALAIAGKSRDRLQVDFLKPRLAPPRASKFGRNAIIMTCISAVVAIFIGWLSWDVHKRQGELDSVVKALKEAEPNLNQARDYRDKLATAELWSTQRAPILDCLRDLTSIFPEDGKIWATRVQLNDGNKWQLTGKATDTSVIFSFSDRLKTIPGVTDIKNSGARGLGGNSRDFSFTLSFVYSPKK